MSSKPIEVSPLPVIDDTIDIYDRLAVTKSKNEYLNEQLIRTKEIEFVRNKLRWCYYREGVNHLQNCRHLSMQYLELMETMRGGAIKGYKLPIPVVENKEE